MLNGWKGWTELEIMLLEQDQHNTEQFYIPTGGLKFANIYMLKYIP